MVSFKKSVGCFLWLCSAMLLNAQTISNTKELQLQIEQRLQQEDVLAVNNLIKENKSLEVAYALTVLNKNLEIAKEKNDPKALSNTYLTLGNFWHIHDNGIKAYDYYLQTERISRKMKDYTNLGAALMNRSTLLEDNDSRIRMMKQAIQAYEKTDNVVNLMKAHLNLGVAYSEFVDADKKDSLLTDNQKNKVAKFRKNAFKHYGMAASLNKNIQSNEIAAFVNIYFAEWYRYDNDYFKAKEHFEKGREFFKKENNIKGLVYTNVEIALIEFKLGNLKKALQLLQTTEQYAEKYQFKNYLEDIYSAYVSIYTEKKELEKALTYQQLLTDLKVDIANLSNQDQLRILSLEHKLDENQYIIEKYETEEKLNRWLFIIGGFITLLVAILTYYIIKSKKRKIENIEKRNEITKLEKNKIETELKNQLLEEALLKEKVRFSQEHLRQFAFQVNKIEEFIGLMKTKLKMLPQNSDKLDIINSLKLSFSNVLNGQNHLKQLSSYSSNLNQEFFFYLKKNYLNISKEDEQLLAYIILGMDSKEIGRILNITTDSVYKKRHRLRQKLNLSKDDSFQDFYEEVMARIK